MSYDQQVENAKKVLRHQAKHSPWLYAQYHNWCAAVKDLERAKEKEREERAKWEQIAGPLEE